MSYEPKTSGYIERAILNQMVSDAYQRYYPVSVGDVLDAVRSVAERGGYGDVQRAAIRRAFRELHGKGLVQRVDELTEGELREQQRFELGACFGDDPSDPQAYQHTSDDDRVTDWILTEQGRREIEELDKLYSHEVDSLAATYGRPRWETGSRVSFTGEE